MWYRTWSVMEGSWPIISTNVMEIQWNGVALKPVASLQRLLIQANIFWPIKENWSGIKFFTPNKSFCNSAKAEDFEGVFLFPFIFFNFLKFFFPYILYLHMYLHYTYSLHDAYTTLTCTTYNTYITIQLH